MYPPFTVANNRKRRVLERCGQRTLTISVQKLDVIVCVTDVIARHYSATQDVATAWAAVLAKREGLAATSLGRHWAMFHQFQHGNRNVVTTNERLDWWLLLFPQGIDWGAFDAKPVHALYGWVKDEEQGWSIFDLRVACLLEAFVRNLPHDGRQISALNPLDAARLLNQELGRHLRHLATEMGMASRR